MIENYDCISSCEGSNGVGVKIYVAVPKGRTLSEKDQNDIQHIGYTLYNDVQGRLHKSDPEEIEATKRERGEILAVFGDRPIFVEEIPNGYDKQYGRPWFVVTTSIGRFKIGWRKRVINIDYTETLVKVSAEELFKDEQTTKSGTYDDARYLHAWGYDKAKEYIDKIHAQVQKE